MTTTPFEAGEDPGISGGEDPEKTPNPIAPGEGDLGDQDPLDPGPDAEPTES